MHIRNNKGDTLIIMQENEMIMLEKTSEKMKADFIDLLKNSEEVARELWNNKEDEIWNTV